jgi:predicted O-linked N-acetylglucosamine transferase (SPINDLY family)
MSQIGLDENLKQLINYINRNNYPEAEKKISELINIDDYNIPIFYNLVGVVNEKIHKLNLAEENFQKAIELDDKFYPAVFNLGMLKFNNNLYDQAIIFFNKTLEIEPNYYDASHMLAQSFVKLKNFDLAINTYQKTIKIDLNNKAAYINLANLFLALHLDIEAQSTLETAAKKITEDYQILNNLGLIYKKLNKIDEAINLFSRTLALKIDEVEPDVNLSLCYFEKQNYVKSLEFIEKALIKHNSSNEIFYYKSLILERIGKLDEALENIEKSILIKKDYFSSIQKKIEIYIKLLRHKESKILLENLDLNNETVKLDNIGLLIFFSNYIFNLDQKYYFKLIELHSSIQKKESEFILRKIKKELLIQKNILSKKIRIGFISADFNNHAVSFQLKNFFILLSKNSETEIFFYYNSGKKDEINLELRSYIKNWADIENSSVFQIVEKISNDNLDVLVDLSGFTEGNKLEIFPYKLCKNQITWAGYLNSVGVEGIDYMLADPFVVPKDPDFEGLYKEKILRFDNCWSTLSLLDEISNADVNNLPFFKNKILSFGSQNNYFKYNERVLEVWSDILKYTQNSQLLLSGNKIFLDKDFQEKVFKVFQKKNIDETRIILKGSSERHEALKNYNNFDICLDPFPYNGGTTNFEASYMCVPTITLVGKTFISRCGYSVNKNLNNDDWNCYSEEEYINKAINFASNPELILEAKKRIYKNVFVKKKFSSKNLVENFLKIVKKLNLNADIQ